MPQVAPSILAADFAHLARDCRRVVTQDNRILHFDVMDGSFVPNLSVGLPVLESLKKALPEAYYDVHLMILRPADYAERFAKAGADAITFHIEAEGDPLKTVEIIHNAGCKAGVSLRPGTPAEVLFPLLQAVDIVLVMSVEPGFGGQAFQPEALGRIKAIRAEAERLNTPLTIIVDGGIDPVTGPQCATAGADVLVAGSAVFGAADPAAAVQAIRGE